MRKLLLALCLVCGAAKAQAEGMTGGELAELCAHEDRAVASMCNMYFVGIADSLVLFSDAVKGDMCFEEGKYYTALTLKAMYLSVYDGAADVMKEADAITAVLVALRFVWCR